MSLPTDKQPENARVKVGILGLNSTGWQMAIAFAAAGPVLGFLVPSDSDGRSLGEAGPPFRGADMEVTGDLRRLDEPETLLVCIPVSLTPARGADMTALAAVVTAVA